MQRCLNSPLWKFRLYYTTIGFFLLGILFFTVAVMIIFDVIHTWRPGDTAHNMANLYTGLYITVFLAAVSFLWIWMSHRYFIVHSRKFTLDENGIAIHYCNKTQRIYPWKDIADICVCDVDQRKDLFDMVIRLGACTEKNGPLHPEKKTINGYESWRNGLYLLCHPDDVIYLDFSIELLKQLEALSKKTVLDRRTKLGKNQRIELWDS